MLRLKNIHVVATLSLAISLSLFTAAVPQDASAAAPDFTLEAGQKITAKGGWLSDPSSSGVAFVNGRFGGDQSLIPTYVNPSAEEIYFTSIGNNIYATHYQSFLTLHPELLREDANNPMSAKCYPAIEVLGGSGTFVGVNIQSGAKTDGCSSSVQRVIADEKRVSGIDVQLKVTEANAVFRGITVPTCIGTSDGACIAQRLAAIDKIKNLSCNTGTAAGIADCTEKENMVACLNLSLSASVGSCLGKDIAKAVAGGDVSTITADTTDDQIQLLCRALTNKTERDKCVKAATTQRDKLVAERDTKDNGDPLCAGGALGWVLCPLTTALTAAISGVAVLVEQLLVVDPLIIGDNSSGDAIYQVWKLVVGIANLALVVAFLVVIFSQATSVGLSAYGIKKMLPRIIAAAILINLSYFICAIAVDLANIMGAAVQGIVSAASSALPDDSLQSANPGSWFVTVIGSITTAAVLAQTGAIFYILPVVASAAVAIFTALFVLAARQILITLLIIVSPLAFAAFVLPNTESLYKKWSKLFMTLLIMYPLIMLLFYGSMLMSRLISATTPGDDAPLSTQIITDLMSVIILVVPLFALPTLMKLAGGILERFGGIVNDRSKGIVDRSTNWAKGRQGERKQLNQDRKIAKLSKLGDNSFRRKFSPTANRINRLERNRQASESSKLGAARIAAEHSISKGGDPVVTARARAVLDELDMKDAKVKLDFQFNGDAQKAIRHAIKTGDDALLQLSAGKMVDTAKLEEVQQLMDGSHSSGVKMSDKQIASTARSILNDPGHFSKTKEQDLGMMYALPELADESKAKATITALTGGGSEYDKRAMGASEKAIAQQEANIIKRQGGVLQQPDPMDPTKTIDAPHDPAKQVLSKAEAARILAVASAQGEVKNKNQAALNGII